MSSSSLSQPIVLKLSGKVIPNRLYRTALSEYSGSYKAGDLDHNGKPLKQYVDIHKDLADGGAGLICFGNIPVHREHMESSGNVILDKNVLWDPVEAFRPAIQAAKSRGAICLPELSFPGRQAVLKVTKHPKSASDVHLAPSIGRVFGQPTPLGLNEIKDLVQRFVWASEVLAKAGADGIMLHAAHGYIFTQFLSPITNKRTDEYGGSLRNRARFLLEVVNAIKAALGTANFVIGVKLNCHDFISGGTTFAEASVVTKWLEDAGVDFFDISGGTYSSPAWRGLAMDVYPGFPSGPDGGGLFLEWAKDLRRVVTRAVVGTTGGWRSSRLMESAVKSGEVDMCGLGKPLMKDPNFVNVVLNEVATKL